MNEIMLTVILCICYFIIGIIFLYDSVIFLGALFCILPLIIIGLTLINYRTTSEDSESNKEVDGDTFKNIENEVLIVDSEINIHEDLENNNSNWGSSESYNWGNDDLGSNNYIGSSGIDDFNNEED